MWNQFAQMLSTEEQDQVIEAAVKELETLTLAEIRDRDFLSSQASQRCRSQSAPSRDQPHPSS
jgi:hypothetical protein